MFDPQEKKSSSAHHDPWQSGNKNSPPLGLDHEHKTPGASPLLGQSAASAVGWEPGANRAAAMNSLFGCWFSDGPSCGGMLGAHSAELAAMVDVDKTQKALKSRLAKNPAAARSLDELTRDKGFQSLPAEQRTEMLKQFQTSPNAATTRYLKGQAEYERDKAEDKSGDPEKEKARLAKLEDARNPDSGSFRLHGQQYTISHGKLLDAQGKEAGTIDNLGNYKMSQDKESSSYYDNLDASVKLQEGSGKDQKTLLNLHSADPNGQLDGADMNQTFAAKAKDTLRAVRHEGMDMGVAPQGAFRSFDEQDKLYAQGRTTKGKQVTKARGGESWHNYGLATDLGFYNEKGQIHWPEKGDYGKQWSRYGELAKEQGLHWGGDWKNPPDRPHMEYHPGFGDREAGQLKPAHKKGGLEAVWDQMGIGQIPDQTQPPPKCHLL